jgi:hypothetical protein
MSGMSTLAGPADTVPRQARTSTTAVTSAIGPRTIVAPRRDIPLEPVVQDRALIHRPSLLERLEQHQGAIPRLEQHQGAIPPLAGEVSIGLPRLSLEVVDQVGSSCQAGAPELIVGGVAGVRQALTILGAVVP